MRTQLKSVCQVLDTKYLTITDLSVYNNEIPVTSSIYRITIPNFSRYVDIPYQPGTALSINSNLLKLTSATSVTGLVNLPSGLWTINQSICPNDQLYNEYYFFNIAPNMEKLKNAVCCHKDHPDKLDALWALKQEFELAKILAEDCKDTKAAVALYNQASNTFGKFDCTC